MGCKFWESYFYCKTELSVGLDPLLFYKSKCPSVCLSVCTFEVPLKVFLPPLPEVGCPIFLEIRNPWGKIVERSGLIFEHFCLKIV